MRFTSGRDATYALLCDLPGVRTFSLRNVRGSDATKAVLLGEELPLDVEEGNGGLQLTLPERLPVQPAHAIALTGVSWNG